MKIKDLLDIYRLRHGLKISALRLNLYVFFGLATSGVFRPVPYLIDATLIFFFLMSASFYNDYYDWKILGEKNAISEHNVHSSLYGILPLIFVAVCFFILLNFQVTIFSLIALLYSVAVLLFYSIPPIRFKKRKILNIIIPATGLYAFFLQAFTLVEMPIKEKIPIAILVLLFAFYLEFLHIIDDSLHLHETVRLSTPWAFFILRSLGFTGVFLSITFIYLNPLYIVSLWSWVFRLYGSYSSAHKIAEYRRSLLSPIWHIEDFMLYAILSIVNILA